MENKVNIRAIYNGASDVIQIFVSKIENAQYSEGTLSFEKKSRYEYQKPAIQLQPEDLQRLMNDLWQLGIRPAGEGHTGQIAAMKEHLSDMKKIAGKFLKVEL